MKQIKHITLKWKKKSYFLDIHIFLKKIFQNNVLKMLKKDAWSRMHHGMLYYGGRVAITESNTRGRVDITRSCARGCVDVTRPWATLLRI